MKKILIPLLMGLMFSAPLLGGDSFLNLSGSYNHRKSPVAGMNKDKELMKLAQSYYDQEKFLMAENMYNQLLGYFGHNDTLYYNLGNVYFRLEKPGQAKAFYLKALKLSPRDKDIKYNISVVNEGIIDKIEEQHHVSDLLVGWINAVSENEFQWVVLISICMFNVCLLLHMFFFKRILTRHITIVLAVIVVINLGLMGIKSYIYHSVETGVVISKKVPAKSGPLDNQPTLFFVHEGIDCRVLKRSAAWVEVRLKNGFSGWIKADDIMII